MLALETIAAVTLRREIGSNALDLISSLAVSSTHGAILEFISNSYDADATIVKIDYDPVARRLSIEDNGTGMTPINLKGFYRSGDSEKLTTPISARGRRRIGKFGIATILLKYLSNEYELETRKEGIKTRIQERLEEQLSQYADIAFQVDHIDPEEHGTTITITDPKFSDGNGQLLKNLRKNIQWGMPLLPDFQIYINGEEVKPKSIQHATEFRIKEQAKLAGKIDGSIYLTNSKSEMAGIHVYVNGRRVGDPNSFVDFNNIKMGLAGKVVAIINADGLEPAILFDRGRFNKEHPNYQEFQKALDAAIFAVRRYTESRASSKNRRTFDPAPTLDDIKKLCLEKRIADITADTEFIPTIELPEHQIGEFKGKRITINTNYPSLRETNGNAGAYETALLHAVVELIAAKGSSTLADFRTQQHKIWETLRFVPEGPRPDINPYVVYAPAELARITGKPLGSIKYLLGVGVLEEEANGVTGRSYKCYEKRTRKMQSLYEYIRNQTCKDPLNFEKVKGVLNEARDYAQPFVLDLGTKDNCYFIEMCCEEDIAAALRSPDLDRRRGTGGPEAVFRLLGSRHYSIPDLAKHTKADVPSVMKALDYARTKALSLEKKTDQGTTFRFGDYVRVLQHMRGEDGKLLRPPT